MVEKYWFIVKIGAALALLISAILLFQNHISESRATAIIESGTLQKYTLESWEDNRDGYWISVRNTKTNHKTIAAFVSLRCPQFESRAHKGKNMLLVERKHMKLTTQEVFTEMYRSFYYLCTDRNMEQEDKDLLQRIENAHREAFRALHNIE